MGLFGLFGKKEKPEETKNKKVEGKSNILLAMPMFTSNETFDITKVKSHLKNHWGLKIESEDGEDSSVMTINGEMVAIMNMPASIPAADIDGAAQYAYNWPKASEELKLMTSHAIVTMMSGNGTQVERYKLFTKVLASVASTSNCIGVYTGSQTLLTPKGQFVDNAQSLHEDAIPVSLWIYIGLRKSDKGNGAYTYGLELFGKRELEVVNSSMQLEQLYDFIYNISSYVLSSDVTFQSGQTLGFTADQKINITLTKGTLVEGQVFRLDM
jgi:hypothetical protein